MIRTVTLTNVSKSPRGLHDAHGRCIVIQGGDSKTVQMTDALLKLAIQIGPFEIRTTETEADKQAAEQAQANARADVQTPRKTTTRRRKR